MGITLGTKKEVKQNTTQQENIVVNLGTKNSP